MQLLRGLSADDRLDPSDCAVALPLGGLTPWLLAGVAVQVAPSAVGLVRNLGGELNYLLFGDDGGR